MSSDEDGPALHRHTQHKYIDSLQLYSSNKYKMKTRKERRVLVGWLDLDVHSYQQVRTFSDHFSAGTSDQPKTKEK
jgi:hypothetical protein